MDRRLLPDEIEAVLHRQRVGRLASLADDRPDVVPIAYAYAGGAVYGRALSGRTPRALRRDPRVGFEVDERDGPAGWCGVVADGVVEAVTDAAERRAATALLAGAGVGDRPRAAAARGAVFRLRLGPTAGRCVGPAPAVRREGGRR